MLASCGWNPCKVRAHVVVMLILMMVPLVRAQGRVLENAPKPVIRRGIQRFEAGVEAADMGTGCGSCYLPPCCRPPSLGIGAEGVWNWKPYLALEADYLITPNAVEYTSNSNEGGRAIELLAGARAELRARHYGYYLKAEAGSVEWTRVFKNFVITPNSFTIHYGRRHSFGSDFGAGFEYSPSSRVHIRTEVTDLLVDFPASVWRDHLQSSAGVYYGFGKNLIWAPPVVRANSLRTFFNRTNVTLITISALASIADGVTTQRFIQRGYREGDPFARPLVKYGWAGQSAAIAIEMGGEAVGMYGLQRIGHRWLARFVPVAISITHAVFAYKNTEYPAQPRQTVP